MGPELPNPGGDVPVSAGRRTELLPGKTVDSRLSSSAKIALAMLTAEAGLGPAGVGTDSGSSTSSGCCGAARATPLPSPIAPTAANARPMPRVARVNGMRAFGFVNVCWVNGNSSNSTAVLSVLQALKSLWKQWCTIVTVETRHDHGSNSIGLLTNLGVCLPRPCTSVGAETLVLRVAGPPIVVR
jgi:hypothetical protein